MVRWLLGVLLWVGGHSELAGQGELYSKAYGDSLQPAIVFLHGGPGYDAFSFEATTAEALAARGYYVVVYDRRGEGRSVGTADYTFAQSVADLDSLYAAHGLHAATLLGHSFGGIVGMEYAHYRPQRVTSLILLGAPLSLQASLRNIIDRSRQLYTEHNDTTKLQYLDMVAAMDTASFSYSGFLLGQALQNGFYRPAAPSSPATAMYAALRRARIDQEVPSSLNPVATVGFIQREHFTTLDLTDRLTGLLEAGTTVFGIYGMEDGLYSTEELKRLEALLGHHHFQRIGSASHNVFIDQQPTFLTLIEDWVK